MRDAENPNPLNPNQELKRAVMKAPIRHADVALKALHRIDHDTTFRDAMQAAVATADLEAVACFVYSHFQPEEPEEAPGCTVVRRGHEHERPKLPKLSPPIDAAQLVRLINDRTVEVAAAYLTEGALDEAVNECVTTHLHDLLSHVMGLRNSYNGFEFDPRKETDVARAMTAQITAWVGPLLDKLLSEVDPAELFTPSMLKRARKAIKEAYKDAVDHYLHERINVWAETKARLDVAALFNSIGGSRETEEGSNWQEAETEESDV